MMKIAVAIKVVPDDQDIQIGADGSLDYSKAPQIVSVYDLNAIEAAAQLAEEVGDSQIYAITVGGTKIDDSKLKKSILARGADELYMAIEDSSADLDARATALRLNALIDEIGEIDVVFAGDGSADNYAQQVDVQLGVALGWPSVNAVTSVKSQNSTLVLRRSLEDEVEVVEVPLPAVVAVTPDVGLPRIPGMKDILAAGKKPMSIVAAASQVASSIETVSVKAPEQVERSLDVLAEGEDGAIEKFAAALKAAL